LLEAHDMAKTYQTSFWLQMAEEARAVAACLHDDKLQHCLLAVAERYVVLARRAETLARWGEEEPE
jgi:hypothetical protein